MPDCKRFTAVMCARRRAILLLVAATFAAPTAGAAAQPLTTRLAAAPVAQADPTMITVPVGAEPDGSSVSLDVDIYRPDGADPAPAVILGHGFSGSKDDLGDQAQRLADEGFLALTYSARGFGESGGRVHLNDPEFEIADAQALIDELAQDESVRQDADGDPRVAMVGGSYGGAMALMTAGADDRVDSVVAQITWNDLGDAFYPQAAIGVEAPGPFKKVWAATFFSAVLGSAIAASGERPDSELPDSALAQGNDPLCGRFDPELCESFLAAMEAPAGDDEPDKALVEVLAEHSPAATLADVTAPTYLVQGMSDSLFGLDHADANARALVDAGVPVAVDWFNGGHDGQTSVPPTQQPEGGPPGDDGSTVSTGDIDLEEEQFQNTLTWLKGTLDATGPVTQDTLPLPAFSFVAPPPLGGQAAQKYTEDAYPGLAVRSGDRAELSLSRQGPPALLSPPGAVPEALTTVPGLGGALGALPTYPLAALPGQHVAFDTEPIPESVLVSGAPRVSLQVTSSAEQASFFLSLWEVQSGGPVLPRRLVAPVDVEVTPGRPERVDIALPGGTWQLPAGSTWRVLVSATDGSFRVDPQARIDQIALAEPTMVLPVTAATAVSPPSRLDGETIGVGAALVALLLILTFAAIRARVRAHPVVEQWRDVPLVVTSLTKAYPDGHRAVDDVSWRAERGQVVGLLGPNGAGKTTTLRMVMGLIAQDGGTVHVLGQPVYAGAPVLQRVGALVEGPGFLPHLSGRDNLKAYWAATGRPAEEALFDDALEIAALGGAVDRPVKSYSQGMRQRLGIAQAMLGMPEVLILDEPTNGLDPPQIAAMRPMLQRYAEADRTVVVSSHLLAEVEMTCSHVVVMHAGKVLAAGSVEEVGVAQGRNLEEVFLSTIAGAGDGGSLTAVRPR